MKETLSKGSVGEILKGVNGLVDAKEVLPEKADKCMPIYDKRGNLIGYLPIYKEPW